MANPIQVYTIVNSIAEQSLGMKALTATDTTFISVGKTVLSSENNIDAFYKTLVDRIGRTVLALREYETDVTEMAREPFVYGAILQKLSFKLPQSQQNDTWLEQGSSSDPFEETTTEFMQVFFDKWEAWEVPGTVPDVQLETAFTSAQAMMAFIDGILMMMNEKMKLDYENLGYMTRAALIADVMFSANTMTAINLLAEYNTEMGTTLTKAKCLYDSDFYRWSGMRMGMVSDQMVKYGVLFNKAQWNRHTPKDKQVFEMLTNFAKGFDVYLQSDVYHNELTKLPYFKKIPYWQGCGKDWSFDSVSSVNLKIESYNYTTGAVTTQTVSKSGIVAVIRDIDSCGITIDKRRTKSIYNPRREVTNYWLKAEMGHFRDMSENCVVFYVEDVVQPVTPPSGS